MHETLNTQDSDGVTQTITEQELVARIESPTSFKVIYVYSIPGVPSHKDCLKVGDATLHTNKEWDEVTQDEVNQAARNRINDQTRTAEVKFELEHAELAVRPSRKYEGIEGFRDYNIHNVLKNSGLSKAKILKDKNHGEWFKVTVDEVKEAIKAFKAHEVAINDDNLVITLRPEQVDAIKQTKSVFNNGSIENPKRMLWNAKMRFGKTLTSYKLIQDLSQRADSIKKVLILTHRPDVHDGWLNDFRLARLHKDGWLFGSKRSMTTWNETSVNEKFVWFASIQDLRGSAEDSTNFNEMKEADFSNLKKNNELFSTDFDLIITDEAHEGNLTPLAKQMFRALKSRYFLDLSGTPFNLLSADSWEDLELANRFTYDGKYTWSYPDERRAKKEWDRDYPNSINPYAELPEIKFITYDVSDSIPELKKATENEAYGSISFTDLFRVSDNEGPNGEKLFVNEGAVKRLLYKMLGDDEKSLNAKLFPFNEKHYGDYFQHTLWMLPNVPAVEAMFALLKRPSSGFSGYHIINATGEGEKARRANNANEEARALDAVKEAIKNHDRTITLSQGMLTTGVTVPEWTAVFMLNNTTSPMQYMQTAFRCTSSGSLRNGRTKDIAYVFDFHPDRCLQQIVESALANSFNSSENNAELLVSSEVSDLNATKNEAVKVHLEYISVLTMDGSKFVEPDSNAIMEQLNEAYINEVVGSGFSSPKLWNNIQLSKFSISRAAVLNQLRSLQGSDAKKIGEVKVSGITDEERKELLDKKKQVLEAAKAKAKGVDGPPELTVDEKNRLKELENKDKAEKKNRQNGIDCLVGVAARMPLLVFASPADVAITPDNFNLLIDEESWREFMPKNLIRIKPDHVKSLTDDLDRAEIALARPGGILYWDDIKQFFDSVIFSGASERIRQMTRIADSKPPIERAFRIGALFSTFKNPDKETVLTPLRVVEMQLTQTLGGLSYLDLVKSTPHENIARSRNLETGEYETHSVQKTIRLMDAGTHEIAPLWIDPVNYSSDDSQSVTDGLTVDYMNNNDNLEENFNTVKPTDSNMWELTQDKNITVYDINSKTALYPLFAATSLYFKNIETYKKLAQVIKPFASNSDELNFERKFWRKIVENSIYLNCRVDYSRKIAERVLLGYDYETIPQGGKTFDNTVESNNDFGNDYTPRKAAQETLNQDVSNITTVDVIKLKSFFEKDWNIALRNGIIEGDRVTEKHDFIGQVLRLSNTGFVKNSGVNSRLEDIETDSARLNELLNKVFDEVMDEGE